MHFNTLSNCVSQFSIAISLNSFEQRYCNNGDGGNDDTDGGNTVYAMEKPDKTTKMCTEFLRTEMADFIIK